jgi:hypothetical protein
VLLPHHAWVVVLCDCLFVVTVERLRKWAYRQWAVYPVQGGDDREFWGVLLPMTRLVGMARDAVTPQDRAWIAAETARLRVTRPPAYTLSLWPTPPS